MRLDRLMKTNWDSRGMRAADWLLTAAVLAAGIWFESWLLIAFAAVGAVATVLRPMGKLQERARGALRKGR